MNISKRCCTVLLLIIAVLYATDLGTLYCQTNRVNVRTEPNTNSEIQGRLSINDSITPIDENENWYKVNYENEEACVYSQKVFLSYYHVFFDNGKSPIRMTYFMNIPSSLFDKKVRLTQFAQTQSNIPSLLY